MQISNKKINSIFFNEQKKGKKYIHKHFFVARFVVRLSCRSFVLSFVCLVVRVSPASSRNAFCPTFPKSCS